MKTKLLFLLPMLAVFFAACEKSKDDPKQNHEAVDLGLSVKWATCNVGATQPEEYGDYFAWGETKPKEVYDWSTYKYMQNGKSSWEYITKYTIPDNQKTGIWYNGDTFIGDNKTTLDLADDAAHVNWGGSWRMPTVEEFGELHKKCTWTLIQKKGINGYEVEGPNGNSIFLPAASARDGSSLYDVGSDGHYWSSSLYLNYWEGYSQDSYFLCFYSDYVDRLYSDLCSDRYYGRSVRPVCK